MNQPLIKCGAAGSSETFIWTVARSKVKSIRAAAAETGVIRASPRIAPYWPASWVPIARTCAAGTWARKAGGEERRRIALAAQHDAKLADPLAQFRAGLLRRREAGPEQQQCDQPLSHESLLARA